MRDIILILRQELPSTAVSKQVEPMIYKANLILQSGILRKLSDFERYGDTIIHYENEIIKLDIGLDFKLLEVIISFSHFFKMKNIPSKIISKYLLVYILS